jgi:hypothetical protein
MSLPSWPNSTCIDSSSSSSSQPSSLSACICRLSSGFWARTRRFCSCTVCPCPPADTPTCRCCFHSA